MGLSANANQEYLLVFGLLLVLAALDSTAATGACSGTAGLDYGGGKIVNDGKREITDSDEDCCRKCSARSDCNYWSRVLFDNKGSKRGECWLRKWIDSESTEQWAISSGEKKGACSGTAGLDFGDGEVINDGKKEITKSDQECCQKCNNRSDCKYWSRVTYDYEGSKRGECWLRKSIGYASRQNWAVSSGEKEGKCQVSMSLDIRGGEVINDGKKDITGSDWECCQKCEAQSDCVSWTRLQHRRSTNKKGECWLRKSIGSEHWGDSSFNSGKKHGSKHSVTSCNIEAWITYDGATYLNDGGKDVVASPEECCAKCDARSDCKYWTRSRSGRECWLISSMSYKQYYSRGFDAGEKEVYG